MFSYLLIKLNNEDIIRFVTTNISVDLFMSNRVKLVVVGAGSALFN